MRKKIIFLLCALVGLTSNLAFGADTNAKFPGRDLYPEVPTYELDEVFQKIGKISIVDVRSQYEFDTLRIKDSINISLTDKDFDGKLRTLRGSTDNPIVFYCNGITCHKSYQAVRRALFLKIDHTYAFDAGIFAWAKAHPNHSVLLGRSPINPADIIEKEVFNSHLLGPNEFGTQIGDTSIVLDVRDRFQREAVGFFPGIERRIALDQADKLDKMLQKAKREDKTLLIYDEAGHQVQWLQYRLVDAGVKNYYFMKGGAKAYYDMLSGKDAKEKK